MPTRTTCCVPPTLITACELRGLLETIVPSSRAPERDSTAPAPCNAASESAATSAARASESRTARVSRLQRLEQRVDREQLREHARRGRGLGPIDEIHGHAGAAE